MTPTCMTVLGLLAGGLPLAQASTIHQNTNVELVVGMVLFAAAGFLLAFGALTLGRIAAPKQPHPEKAAAYECGEPAIGDGWVQFDLRFYTVALVFIVFDVEVALLWPWAVAFKPMVADGMGAAVFWPFLVFFTLIAIPFLYEWKSGYLDWVRAFTAHERPSALESSEGGE